MKARIYHKISAIALLALAFVFVVSCEGPEGVAGLDGVDGIDGVDGNLTCLVCHSDGNIQSVKEQFHQSVHSSGQVAVAYAGARSSCARCHSNQGFVEFATNGTVAENIAAPTAWECSTCHGLHETFDSTDYALRLDDPIAFIFDNAVTADFGNGNLCANCHQSRRSGPADMGGQFVDLNGVEDDGPGGVGDDDEFEVPAGQFFISSTHYGPHHGAQSNTLYGAGFAEMTGSMSYPVAGTATHFTSGSCTSCHMAESTDTGEGGHTWNPAVDACTTCHAGATDFDIGGTMTEIAAQLDVLRDLLEVQGVIEEGVTEIFELDPETGDIVSVLESDGFHPVVNVFTVAQSEAFFNWVGLLEDRSFGAHNPAYTRALLTNSIEAITP